MGVMMDTTSKVPWRSDARVIGLVGLVHATSHFSHLLLAPLFPIFIADFDLTFAQVGLLMTVFFVVSGVGQAVSGFVVDRFGAHSALLFAMVMFFLASATAFQAQGYESLIVASVLAGMGNAPFHPADFSILNHNVTSSRLGYAFSVHGISGNLGWALAPVFLLGIHEWLGWRQAYAVACGLYLIIFAVLLWQRAHLQSAGSKASTRPETQNSFAFARLPVVWFCFGFFMFSTMTLAVIQSFSPSILIKVHDVSLKDAALVVTAYMVCGAIGMLVGGFVAHATDHTDRIIAWTLSVAAVLLMLCATGWLGSFWTPVVLAATGFATGVAGPSRDLLIKKATPKQATGRVYGTVYSGLDIGFAISPVMFG